MPVSGDIVAQAASEVARDLLDQGGALLQRSLAARDSAIEAADSAVHAVGTIDAVAETAKVEAIQEATRFVPVGAGAVERTVFNKLSDLPITSGDYASPLDIEGAALPLVGQTWAYRYELKGPDGTDQMMVGFTPFATTHWSFSGGISSGPVMYVDGEYEDIDGTVALKGAGSFLVGNASGIIGGIVDNGLGKRAELYAALVPGPNGTSGGVRACGSSNASISLEPAGQGAVSRNQPDGTASGGVGRGPYATDWQAHRSGASDVAAGSYSVIGGGFDSRASGFAAVIGGGSTHICSGQYSWIPGGLLADDRSRTRTGVWSGGQFSTRGDAQSSESIFRRQTSGASPAVLTADNTAPGTTNICNLPNNGLYVVQALLAARQTSGSAGTVGDAAWKVVTFAIKRGSSAAATALVGSVATLASGSDAAASAWVFAVSADTTNGGISLTVTGEANKNVRAVARLLAVEVVG